MHSHLSQVETKKYESLPASTPGPPECPLPDLIPGSIPHFDILIASFFGGNLPKLDGQTGQKIRVDNMTLTHVLIHLSTWYVQQT